MLTDILGPGNLVRAGAGRQLDRQFRTRALLINSTDKDFIHQWAPKTKGIWYLIRPVGTNPHTDLNTLTHCHMKRQTLGSQINAVGHKNLLNKHTFLTHFVQNILHQHLKSINSTPNGVITTYTHICTVKFADKAALTFPGWRLIMLC